VPIFSRKPHRKSQFGRSNHKCGTDTEIQVRESGFEGDLNYSSQDNFVVGFCEHGDGPSDSINAGHLLTNSVTVHCSRNLEA
jgi:hypothetical protein